MPDNAPRIARKADHTRGPQTQRAGIALPKSLVLCRVWSIVDHRTEALHAWIVLVRRERCDIT